MKPLGRPPYTCLITRGELTAQNFDFRKSTMLETIAQAAADGVSMIQIREKALPARMLFKLTSAVVAELADTRTLVLVNDRYDVAIASGADGVHLPGNSIPAGVVRSVLDRELVIGASTHSIEEARAAMKSGADYIFFGPVFESPGKGTPLGLAALRKVSDGLQPFPVIGLGGIDQNNFTDVMAVGAAGIAAIRSLNDKAGRKFICERLARTQVGNSSV